MQTWFYIALNGAYTKPYYWSQPAQNWTTDSDQATLFDTRENADAECVYADAYGPGEAYVCEKRV